MNKELLIKHITKFSKRLEKDPQRKLSDFNERIERINYYQSWNAKKIAKMNEHGFTAYLSKLWAMCMWGNKAHRINQIISSNGFENIKKKLIYLLFDESNLETRWDTFLSDVKYFGPSMVSEILCHYYPDKYMIWNKKSEIAYEYLNVPDVPKYNYQLSGEKFLQLTSISQKIELELRNNGFSDVNLLTVDYFIWDELQIIKNSNQQNIIQVPDPNSLNNQKAKSIHNEIRDKLADIGTWLGFESKIEIKIADGSKVDAIWESSIGNMGKIIYVFEVQTKGNIDSLLINLQKALINPAVQGVVAVSDKDQLEIIKKHSAGLGDVFRKLKYWDQEEVLKVYDSLELVNTSINSLGLVPDSFYS